MVDADCLLQIRIERKTDQILLKTIQMHQMTWTELIRQLSISWSSICLMCIQLTCHLVNGTWQQFIGLQWFWKSRLEGKGRNVPYLWLCYSMTILKTKKDIMPCKKNNPNILVQGKIKVNSCLGVGELEFWGRLCPLWLVKIWKRRGIRWCCPSGSSTGCLFKGSQLSLYGWRYRGR